MPGPPVLVESAKGLTPREREVEQRAIDNLQSNLPALSSGIGKSKKYGSEISTDNARDIVSPDYGASREAATEWSRASQRPAAALANYLYDEALRHPDLSKARRFDDGRRDRRPQDNRPARYSSGELLPRLHAALETEATLGAPRKRLDG